MRTTLHSLYNKIRHDAIEKTNPYFGGIFHQSFQIIAGQEVFTDGIIYLT